MKDFSDKIIAYMRNEEAKKVRVHNELLDNLIHDLEIIDSLAPRLNTLLHNAQWAQYAGLIDLNLPRSDYGNWWQYSASGLEALRKASFNAETIYHQLGFKSATSHSGGDCDALAVLGGGACGEDSVWYTPEYGAQISTESSICKPVDPCQLDNDELIINYLYGTGKFLTQIDAFEQAFEEFLEFKLGQQG